MERCDGHAHGGGVRECGKVRFLSHIGVTALRKVKVIRNLFQLMERCDGHGEDVRVCGKV